MCFDCFYIYWMDFTWKKGLGELEKNPESQNKNGEKNPKKWSLSANCLSKLSHEKLPFGGVPYF